MSEITEQVIPPMEFVDRVNSCEDRRGMPRLSPLDPLMMLLWHQAQEIARTPLPLIPTGV